MVVYDTKGVEYKVPHRVDVAEWLEAGYLKDKPVDNENERFNEIVVNLKRSSAGDLKYAVNFLGFEYKNKKDSIQDIESFLNLNKDK